MAEVVKMPKLSDTMTEGVVAEWHKSVGDTVEAGDVLAEIETDKATMEFESFQDGTLLYIGVEKGKAAPVDSILAILGEEGEDISDLISGKGKTEGKDSKSSEKESEEADASAKSKSSKESEPKQEEPSAEKSQEKESSTQTSQEAEKQQEGGRIKASPLAKKMARDKNIDISAVTGTGDGGRIVKADIENYKPAAAQKASVSAGSQESYREEPVSQMRKTIARRLAESKFSAPHFYLTMEINMDNAIAARKSINESLASGKISFNDMVIKAAAAALKKHPKVNASWLGDKIRYSEHVHIGVAVAVEEGLLVPVVRFADTKTLSALNAEVKALAEKAKSKKLQPADWEGNTFTISNLGMYGIDEFTAIINPPDACIMAIGAVKEVPVVKNGQIVAGNIMKITLSCDHRVVDGAVGSEFLLTFKKYMENPVMMLAE